MLPETSAFMVEWHRGGWGAYRRDLIAPLLAHGLPVSVSVSEA